jgi:hypothetical protein
MWSQHPHLLAHRLQLIAQTCIVRRGTLDRVSRSQLHGCACHLSYTDSRRFSYVDSVELAFQDFGTHHDHLSRLSNRALLKVGCRDRKIWGNKWMRLFLVVRSCGTWGRMRCLGPTLKVGRKYFPQRIARRHAVEYFHIAYGRFAVMAYIHPVPRLRP